MAIVTGQVTITATATHIATGSGHANFPTYITIQKQSAVGNIWIGNSGVTAADSGGVSMTSGSLVATFPIYPGERLFGISGGSIAIQYLLTGA